MEISGAGAPIVFLHGGLHFFDNNFAPQQAYFSRFGEVVGIDQRGHGHSPDTPGPYSYREMAEDTAAVIEQLALGPVDVVGHSDGAIVGLLLARYHPALVRRLVISGADLGSGLTSEKLAQLTRASTVDIAARLPPMLKNWREDYGRVSPDGIEHWETLLHKDWQLWLKPVILNPAELKQINIPVLVMAGDHDVISAEDTLEIFHGLPHGQLAILPATGHGTFLQRPELVNELIRTFLAEP
ncbi:MAG: alpha/beta hydrolase [Opitutaceae bacterium]